MLYFLQDQKQLYLRLFRLIQDTASANNLIFNPPNFQIDFEQAVDFYSIN